jgi:hypothetical protein
MVLLVGVAVGSAGLALAIPPCGEICNAGEGYFECYYDGGCIGATQVCMNGQGYCQFNCWDGSVYYMICQKDCPTGGGGSPVFRKQNIEQAPSD